MGKPGWEVAGAKGGGGGGGGGGDGLMNAWSVSNGPEDGDGQHEELHHEGQYGLLAWPRLERGGGVEARHVAPEQKVNTVLWMGVGE